MNFEENMKLLKSKKAPLSALLILDKNIRVKLEDGNSGGAKARIE